MNVVAENQSSVEPKPGKVPSALLLGGAAALVGLAVGLVVWGGLPSRADSATGSKEVGPIALPDNPDDLPVAPELGALAPDFTLETPDGETYTLSDFRGQPVLVNMWATWCGPCRLEMPAIQATYEARQDEGFVVLAVNHTDTDTVPAMVEFGEELGLTFPLLVDPGSQIQKAYQVRAYPSSFFVDEEGIVQTVHFGPMTEGQLNGYVDGLLQ
jgi:peroxiredoxin